MVIMLVNDVILSLFDDVICCHFRCNHNRYCVVIIFTKQTQISFATNLFGLAEEEHSGGAIVMPMYSLGKEFRGCEIRQGKRGRFNLVANREVTFDSVIRGFSDVMTVYADKGYAIDKRYPNVYYIHHDAVINIDTQRVTWTFGDKKQWLKLLPDRVYVHPTGYVIKMAKPLGRHSWRLVGQAAVCTNIHKPATVSGGGKSEIAKRIGMCA